MFEFIKNIGNKNDNKTEEINKQRELIKKQMTEQLKAINFTDDEVNEVLSILEKSEKKIQEKKDELIGTNINNEFPEIIMNKIFSEIREIELEAASKMKSRIFEIKRQKGL